MEAVKEALLDDFNDWLNENDKPLGSRQDQLDLFMKEKYATRVTEGNIFDQIKAMNTPPSPSRQESGSSSGVLHNLAACAAAETDKEESSTQRKEPKRRKRSSTGSFFISFLPYDWVHAENGELPERAFLAGHAENGDPF